jgi:hypothetical protein
MKIISRIEAIALGRKRYYTGKPCKHGHIAERSVVGSGCAACGLERNRRPERLEYLREWRRRPNAQAAQREYHNRPERRETRLAYFRQWWEEHGNEPEKQDARRVRQNLRAGHVPPPPKREWPPKPEFCECCGNKSKRLVMDHNHKIGALRGWTCDSCNLLGDDPIRLQKRIAFLKRSERNS